MTTSTPPPRPTAPATSCSTTSETPPEFEADEGVPARTALVWRRSRASYSDPDEELERREERLFDDVRLPRERALTFARILGG